MDREHSAGDGADDLLKASEELYHDVALELATASQKIRDGEFTEAKAAMQAAKDLRAAFQLVMEERTRLDKLRKQFTADTGAGRSTLDFAAARSEIGRRLACLRHSG